jgi:IclR family pca regulon transcriptional regulator
MHNSFTKKPRYFVQSLAKGLRLLQTFAEAGKPLTLSDITDIMGANNTTTMRLCYTLTELGFIQRDQQKRYNLTPRVLTLGYPVICRLDWHEVAKYYLEKLFEEIKETVNLTILDGSEILFVHRIRKIKYLPFDIQIGTKLPVYCTATGKILMAMGLPEKTRPILETLEFRPCTDFTINSLDRYLEELDEVRKKGYAINDQEFSEIIRSIGAPVLDEQGYAVAAIGITVPITRYSRAEMEEALASHVMRVAKQISNALIQT